MTRELLVALLHNSIFTTEHTETTEQKKGKLHDDRMTTLVILLFARSASVLSVRSVFIFLFFPIYAGTPLVKFPTFQVAYV
ncbi:MAG: hypothetical protein ACHQT8_06100 [Chlamydiales bacterium]